jgi:hypothetical protein
MASFLLQQLVPRWWRQQLLACVLSSFCSGRSVEDKVCFYQSQVNMTLTKALEGNEPETYFCPPVLVHLSLTSDSLWGVSSDWLTCGNLSHYKWQDLDSLHIFLYPKLPRNLLFYFKLGELGMWDIEQAPAKWLSNQCGLLSSLSHLAFEFPVFWEESPTKWMLPGLTISSSHLEFEHWGMMEKHSSVGGCLGHECPGMIGPGSLWLVSLSS